MTTRPPWRSSLGDTFVGWLRGIRVNLPSNTYQMSSHIESGGAKSEELEQTENWFKAQFAPRQQRRRKELIGGKIFADKKVPTLNAILDMKDEEEISFSEEKKKK